MDALARNVAEFGIPHAPHGSAVRHCLYGGTETGLTQPGKFIVCGDSHTATTEHSAPLPGLGQTEVEHVFATQTLWQVKPKSS